MPAVPSPDDERVRIIAAMRSMRQLLGDAIETLLIACDELDGDSDIEQDDSGFADQDALDLDQRGEPSLAAAENHPSSPVQFTYSGERSAFGFSGYTDQGAQADWASGNRDDREGDEHDGGEPDESGIGDQDGMAEQLTGESSLGWTGDMDQTWAMRRSLIPWSVEDGEAGDDNGIGDAGGVAFDDEPYLGYVVPGGIVDAEGPDDNGVADEGGAQEVIGEIVCREGFRIDRERRGRVYVGELTTAGPKPFGAPEPRP